MGFLFVGPVRCPAGELAFRVMPEAIDDKLSLLDQRPPANCCAQFQLKRQTGASDGAAFIGTREDGLGRT